MNGGYIDPAFDSAVLRQAFCWFYIHSCHIAHCKSDVAREVIGVAYGLYDIQLYNKISKISGI